MFATVILLVAVLVIGTSMLRFLPMFSLAGVGALRPIVHPQGGAMSEMSESNITHGSGSDKVILHSTVCLFQCESVTHRGNKNWKQEHVVLRATYDKSIDEHRSFNAASPNGMMEVSIDNPAVHGFFKPGEYYYLTVTPHDGPA